MSNDATGDAMEGLNKMSERHIEHSGSTANGVWYPVCGLIEQGEDIPIMVSCGSGQFKGEAYAETSWRFQRLMKEHDFELEDGWIVRNMQTDRFIEVMNHAGWQCGFLPIGP